MVADIIIISIIVLCAIIGFNRGIAKTLLNIAGLILSALGAYYLSCFIAQFIYDTFIQQSVIENIEQMIQDNGAQYAMANCFDALPQWISGILSFLVGLFGITLGDYEQNIDIAQSLSTTIAESIESTLSSVIVTAITVLLVIILFVLIFILAKKLIKHVNRVFRIPVIKQINQLLGFLFGVIEGLVIVWFFVNLFFAIMMFTDPEIVHSNLVTGDVFKFFCIAF